MTQPTADPADLRAVLERLPGARQLAAGFLRGAVLALAAMLLWHQAGLRQAAGAFYRGTTAGLVWFVERPVTEVTREPSPDRPGVMRTVTRTTTRNIAAKLDPTTYFNLFLPLVLMTVLQLPVTRRRLLVIALATLGIGLFHVLQTAAHAYYAFGVRLREGIYQGSLTENRVVLTVNVVVPLLLLAVSHLAVERWVRRRAAAALKPASVGRNDPCPCGSGRKYKKCCGS